MLRPDLTAVVFSCGSEPYTIGDVFSSARVTGSLEEFRHRWEAEIRAGSSVPSRGPEADDAAIEEATNAFRYARDLVSAEECDRWLAALGLSFAELHASMRRRTQGRLESDNEDRAVGRDESEFLTDALLSDVFPSWGRTLAEHAASAAESGLPLPSGPALAGQWPRVAEARQALLVNRLSEAARRREFSEARLDLLWVECECAELDSEGAAREAQLCVRLDHATLHGVAKENALPSWDEAGFLEERPPEIRSRLSSVSVGDTLEFHPDDSRFIVQCVVRRRDPALAHPAVARRIEARLTERFLRERVSQHVKWRLNLELAG